jgi:hypothetical protein
MPPELGGCEERLNHLNIAIPVRFTPVYHVSHVVQVQAGEKGDEEIEHDNVLKTLQFMKVSRWYMRISMK